MNLSRPKSFVPSVAVVALYFLILVVVESSAYDVNLYKEGCYPLHPNHSFHYLPPTEELMTIDNCRTDCALFEYSVLWTGKVCSCFNEIVTTVGADSSCTSTCDGNGGEICGGTDHMSVYRSRVIDERIPTNITVADTVTADTDPHGMTGWETHSTKVNGFVGSTSPTYLVKVSDGSGRPEDEAVFDQSPASYKLTLLRSSHEYELLATATDEDSSVLTSSLVVETKRPLSAISVNCPQYAASTHEIECMITATGNKMAVELDFGDGTAVRNLNLGDTITDTYGSTNTFDLSTATDVVANELFFLPNFVFKRAGKLLGFKLHASRFDASVTIKIYRPKCTQLDTTYCYFSDSCLNVNITCNGLLDTRSTGCTAPNVWSFSKRKCVDSSGNEQYENNRLIGDVGGDVKDMVYEFTPSITQVGWQSHSVSPDQFDVQPGDMVGLVHTTSTGVVSYINRNMGPRGYRGPISDPAVLPTLSTSFTYDFLLEAYVGRPVEVVVKKTYPDEVDEADVSVRMTSVEDPGTELTDSVYIDVQVEITELSIVTDYSVSDKLIKNCDGSAFAGTTNYTHYFYVPEHPGELPQYTVRWDDETYRLKTFSDNFEHIYRKGGVFNVTINAHNAVSHNSSWTTVAIQDEILGLKLSKDYFITALDNQSTLFISIDQGTNVTYTIRIYDQTNTVYILYFDQNNTEVPGKHEGYNAHLNYTFGAPGNWTMKVVAENCISRQEAILWFKIEIPIVGLDIIDIAPIAYLDPTLVYFSIVNGTDITFSSTFDGLPTREWVMHEAGIKGHEYEDVHTLKVTLVYNLMRDWIKSGRVGPVPVSAEDAEEAGLSELVAELTALGESPFEMLAGPMEEIGTGENTENNTETAMLEELERLSLEYNNKATKRLRRHIDGVWHHGMVYITLQDYEVTGPHVLMLNATNIVQEGVVSTSTTIWVEYIILDMLFLANETFVKTHDFILFNMTVSQLSRANTTIVYGDPHMEMEYRYEMLEDDLIEFVHSYNESGNFTVYLESINNVSRADAKINVTIQDPVTALYLQTNSPVTRPWVEGGWGEIYIYWDPEEALFPTDAFIWISYGEDGYTTDEFFGVDDIRHEILVEEEAHIDDTHDWLMQLANEEIPVKEEQMSNGSVLYTIYAFRSTSRYQYWDFGDYNISINISNLVSWMVWDTVIVVDQDVLDLAIVSDIYHLTFGFEARLDVTRRWGSRVNLTWDYRDSTSDEWAMYKPNEENYMIHQYNEVGVYWVTVTAVNSVGTWIAVLPQPIMVQHPIIGFSLECSFEMVLVKHPKWATRVESFIMLDRNYPLATNVTAVFTLDSKDVDIEPVVVDLNEAYAACDHSKSNATHEHIATVSHIYELVDRRFMTVEMTNLVSNGTYHDSFHVYEEIYNLTLTPKSVLNEADAADPTLWMEGVGVLKDKFPLDHIIVIEIDMLRGTYINYTWDFGDNYTTETYENEYITHKYKYVGTYTITVHASNPLAQAYYEITVGMQRGVGPVSIFTNTPLTKNTTIDLTVDPGWVGTDACHMIDFGIQYWEPEMHPVYFVGDQETCSTKYLSKMAEIPGYRYDFQYSQYLAYKSYKKGNANFTLQFKYLKIGTYEATIVSHNQVSMSNYTLLVGVTRGPCKWPVVNMKTNMACLVDKLCTTFEEEKVRQHWRSKSLEVKADIFINCSSTTIYHHTWLVEEVDKTTGAVIREILPTDLANSRGDIPDFYLPSSLPSILVPKNTLTYGMYRFSLNVSMDGEIGIETSGYVYIEIVKSDLKAGVVGGISRRKGWGTNVTLDAFSESYDPDYPEDRDGFRCRWLCKRENETWPVYDADYNVELIPFQKTKGSYYYPDDTGGCFRDKTNSSGYFDIRPDSIEDAGGCTFTHDYFYSYEREKIEFKVIVEKDTRRKILTTFVDIAEGDPPQIDISSESACLANCKDKLNYAAKYTIQARVTNGRKGTIYIYEWDLFEGTGISELITPYNSHQFGDPGKTLNKDTYRKCSDYVGLTAEQLIELKKTHGRYIDFCEAASTGVNRQAITIEKDLFNADDSANTYYLYVKVYRPGAINYGETFRLFYVNKPPLPGKCNVLPNNGTALVTRYNVECPTPFEDEHKPFKYEISIAGSTCCTDAPEEIPTWKYFHAGNNPSSNEGGVMAMGLESNDYKKWIRVRCYDSVGSWTDIYIEAIIMPAPAEVLAAQAAMFQDTEGEGLFNNPDKAANAASALAQALNDPRSNCTICDMKDMEAIYNATDFEPNLDVPKATYLTSLYNLCIEQQNECEIEEAVQRKATREAMFQKFLLIKPKTVEGCQTKMAAIEVLSSKADEISPDALAQLSAQNDYCVKIIAQAEDKDPNVVEGMGKDIISSSGKGLEAGQQQAEEDMIDGEHLEEQNSDTESNTQRRRRRRDVSGTQQSSSENDQLKLIQSVNEVGDLIGSSKAPGEKASVIATPMMDVAVNLAYGDTASSVPAGDGSGFNLPDPGNMFPDANDTNRVVMSSTVVAQAKNPFVGKNDSSNDTLSINSAVLMLSLKNETGGSISMGNVSKPTHMFIKRDPKSVTVNSLVQKITRFNDPESRSSVVFNKILVPGASSLNIRVVQTWVFNKTNCSIVNMTTADNETLAYCNLTSTIEPTPQPTWLEVTTKKPTTVVSPFFTTTLGGTTTTTADITTTTDATTTTDSGSTDSTNSAPTTTGALPKATNKPATAASVTAASQASMTPSENNTTSTKMGWMLLMAVNSRPSLTRPESYFTCALPSLNDPIKLQQEALKASNGTLNTTGIPDWVENLPPNLERDLDTCFFSNSFFQSPVEIELYLAIQYVPPGGFNASANISEYVSSTVPPSVRKRREISEAENDNSTDSLIGEIFAQIEFYTAQCKVWNHYIKDWETSGCEVGPYSSPTNTHCICTQLEREKPDDWVEPLGDIDPLSGEVIPPPSAPPMSFGAALAVPTNTIDMSGAAFANLGENPLVFSVMVSIMCLYLCLCIWARSADVKDEIKSSTSPLLDNDPRDKYHYELIVYTGAHGGSGTTAKVSVIFSGDEDETPPRLIFDDKKTVLEKGGIDSFIMSCPQTLGSLNVCRIWHDNSGASPSWFFSRLQVTDLQTGEKFFFVLDRWLAVDQDDGCIDRVIPVAGKEELTNFNLIFWSKARKDITDGHIWFSVFGRPHRSRFTRIQRLTCCLSLLFCTMFANIYFYNADDSGTPSPGIQENGRPKGFLFTLGPINLTVTQLLTGIYASLIVFPVNLIVVMVFRYSGQRQKSLPTEIKQKKYEDEAELSRSTLELRQQAEFLSTGDDNNRLLTNLGTTAVNDWGQQGDKKKGKGKFMLPWWFIFVGYLLCLGSVGWSFYAVVSVAFTFGPKKAAEWLGSFCMSFFESVFFTQPIKVLGLAAFYALVIKSPAVEDDDERDPELQKDEVYIHQHKRAKDVNDPRFRKRLRRFTKIPLPPSEEYLKAARALRLKEVKMMDILKEIAIYLIFIYLLLMVGYGNRDPWSHHFYKNVKNLAAHGHWAPGNSYDISNVHDYATFYRWLEETMLSSYYSTEVYDGERHWWTSNFSADYNSVPVGIPRLRLLRTKDIQCPMPSYRYTKRCSPTYSISEQDEEDYLEGWKHLNLSDPDKSLPHEGFKYNTSRSLNGFVTAGSQGMYSGGGYVFPLSHIQGKAYERVAYLKEIEWLDPQTRAVFVEFNLYNSAVNLFAVSYILFEFLGTGAVESSYKVTIFRLDRYVGSQALTVMVAEILTTMFFIFYLVREIKAVRRLKKAYLKSAWNMFEALVLSGCFFSLILYFIRLYICLTTMKRFRENKKAFHNFQMAAGIDELYGFTMSFILFAATIKFTKLLRFNKRIMTLAISMVGILKPLASFGLVFAITFFAFAQMAYMIFVNSLLEFSTFLASANTLFSMMLNKFDYPVLEAANPIFAPIIFLAFVLMMTMTLLNFMLTIILDTYSEIRDELMQQENEYEIVSFITNKVKGLVGMAPPPNLPKMRSENEGFVDDKDVELSSRVEELMEKFMDIVVADPQQRQLADDFEQRKKFLKRGVGINRKIVTG